MSNLDDETFYAVYEASGANLIDTVLCNEQGRFTVFREHEDDLQVITLYYNNRGQWITIYPEAGKPVKVKGDARYPQLLQIKGGRINDKLNQFRQKAAPLLKELADLQRENTESASLSDEKSIHATNLKLELRKAVKDFITKNPDEYASAVLIYEYFAYPNEYEQTEDLLQILSPEVNDFYLVKNMREEIEKIKTTAAGAKAPDFRVTNIYGQTFTVDSFANKHFVLAFTALWCDMCQTEVMKLDNIISKYSKDSLDVLLISLDDEVKDIREMIRRDSIQWNLVADSAGQAIRLFDIYNVNSLPKCFLIDREGVILLNTKNGEELRRMVDKIFKHTD